MLIAAAIALLFPICYLLIYLGEKRDEKERDRKRKEKYETDELYRWYSDMGMFNKADSKQAIMRRIHEDRNRKPRPS